MELSLTVVLSVVSLGKSSQVNPLNENHFALSVCLNHHKRTGMPYYPFEWKSIQASLFNHSHHNQTLSNTTREQARNAQSPKMSDLREGMSSHHSL